MHREMFKELPHTFMELACPKHAGKAGNASSG